MRNLLLISIMAVLLSACGGSSNKLRPQPQPQAQLPNSPTLEQPVETTYKLGAPIALKTDTSLQLYPTNFTDLPGWQQDNHNLAYSAFQRSCNNWRNQSDHKPLNTVLPLGHLKDWKHLCALPVAPGQEKKFFEQWFQPHAVSVSGVFDGLFTGYYLPQLHGSHHKTQRYHVPIYGIPHDLVKKDQQIGRHHHGHFVPYYDRAEIYAGALHGKHAELLWVDSEVDAFFLEIQGSGQVVMTDGSIENLGFAGKNGRAYYPIGRWLADNGYIPREQVSMQSIRAWIAQNPQAGHELMLKNQSFVFFRFNNASAAQGPIGSMNAPLTAGYSLAVDNNYLPLGIPVWLDAQHPSGTGRLQRLVVAQDTGGAIKGPIRGDVYWGAGEQAENWAGVMKSSGRLFVLIPKGVGKM